MVMGFIVIMTLAGLGWAITGELDRQKQKEDNSLELTPPPVVDLGYGKILPDDPALRMKLLMYQYNVPDTSSDSGNKAIRRLKRDTNV